MDRQIAKAGEAILNRLWWENFGRATMMRTALPARFWRLRLSPALRPLPKGYRALTLQIERFPQSGFVALRSLAMSIRLRGGHGNRQADHRERCPKLRKLTVRSKVETSRIFYGIRTLGPEANQITSITSPIRVHRKQPGGPGRRGRYGLWVRPHGVHPPHPGRQLLRSERH